MTNEGQKYLYIFHNIKMMHCHQGTPVTEVFLAEKTVMAKVTRTGPSGKMYCGQMSPNLNILVEKDSVSKKKSCKNVT